MIINTFLSNSKLLFGILVVIISGMFGGYIAASGVSAFIIVILKDEQRIQFLLVLLMIVFALADNFKGPFAFAQNLRFTLLGVTLVVLAQYYLFERNKALLLVAFSIFALVITMAYSPLGSPAILRSLGYLVVGLSIFKLLQLRNEINRKETVQLVITLLFVYFFVNLVIFFVPIYADAYLSGRFSGLMANPNGLGLYAMFSYAFVIWVQKKEDIDFSRWFFTAFKLILFFLIIMSASRTALLGVVAFEITNRFLQYHILLIIGLAGITFLSVLLNNIEIDVIIHSLGLSDYLRVQTLETASGRTEVWQVAFEEFQRHPWLGQGMMYDNYFIDSYAEQRFGDNYARHWNGVWNSYLSLGLNVGIVGLTLFGYFWYRLFKSAKDNVFRVAFLVMILLSAITESWMAASMNAFMPLVFLIWALQIEPNYQTEEI